jgi:type IV fimbrial biogenesis protein FimT
MRKTQHGFTLVEVLAVLAVVAILVGIATPTLRQFSANSRTAAATNSLVTALATARSEAIRQSKPVSVCSSSDQLTCANSADWSTGWIVFADGSGTAGVLDPGDTLLQSWPAPGNMTVNASDKFLQYNARGMTNPPAAFTFNMYVPQCKGQNQTRINVTVGGSPQNTHIACP